MGRERTQSFIYKTKTTNVIHISENGEVERKKERERSDVEEAVKPPCELRAGWYVKWRQWHAIGAPAQFDFSGRARRTKWRQLYLLYVTLACEKNEWNTHKKTENGERQRERETKRERGVRGQCRAYGTVRGVSSRHDGSVSLVPFHIAHEVVVIMNHSIPWQCKMQTKWSQRMSMKHTDRIGRQHDSAEIRDEIDID